MKCSNLYLYYIVKGKLSTLFMTEEESDAYKPRHALVQVAAVVEIKCWSSKASVPKVFILLSAGEKSKHSGVQPSTELMELLLLLGTRPGHQPSGCLGTCCLSPGLLPSWMVRTRHCQTLQQRLKALPCQGRATDALCPCT